MEWFVIIPWVGFSFFAGVFARDRGRRAGPWGLAALAVSPLPVFVLLTALPDEARERRLRAARERAEADRLRLQAERQREAQRVRPEELLVQFERLRQLQDRGVLSVEEAAARRHAVIAKLEGRPLAAAPEELLLALTPLRDDGTLTAEELTALKRYALGTLEAPAEPVAAVAPAGPAAPAPRGAARSLLPVG